MWLAGVLIAVFGAIAHAQNGDPGATFRVFLTDGRALPSYGEATRVGDRLVFTLQVGGGADVEHLQLMSLPVAQIDLEKTSRYAESLRAARYAATRGEADYAAMTAEVQRSLDQLAAIEDPQRRLALADEAKRRLFDWSRANYSYRARDIRELGALFDEVIGELRAAAGQSQFSLDLRAGLSEPEYEPLLATPTLAQAIALALEASRAADVAEERLAILRTAHDTLAGRTEDDSLRTVVENELEAERTAEARYGQLTSSARARADAAMRAGDVVAALAARVDVVAADRALGGRRPSLVRDLLAEIDARIERARAHRLALDHYALVRRALLAYERRTRPVLAGLDRLRPLLAAIEQQRGAPYERLESASRRLADLMKALGAARPPDDLADVHATLMSALHLAEQACARRRLAVSTLSVASAGEASTAAAGAALLAGRVREELVIRLFPPRIE